jgi:hypothetical protein
MKRINWIAVLAASFGASVLTAAAPSHALGQIQKCLDGKPKGCKEDPPKPPIITTLPKAKSAKPAAPVPRTNKN